MILASSMGGELPDRRYILPLLGISAFTYLVLTAAAWGLSRLLARNVDDRGVVAFALVFGNVGFMGYPVVASIFGQQAVFYAAVLNVGSAYKVRLPGQQSPFSRQPADQSQDQGLDSPPLSDSLNNLGDLCSQPGCNPDEPCPGWFRPSGE